MESEKVLSADHDEKAKAWVNALNEHGTRKAAAESLGLTTAHLHHWIRNNELVATTVARLSIEKMISKSSEKAIIKGFVEAMSDRGKVFIYNELE